MKKASSKPIQDDEMREEYDFRGAVRGKHYKPLHEGYTVHIHQPDGSTELHQYVLAEGTVLLQPDVRKYFPDSNAVNAALRSLIALMEAMPHRAVSKKKRPSAQVIKRQ
ncbi:MAG: hypothetical protein JW850_23665 [Thermoflexales bacterium]|nr:hypothetical protein [Thermoflexales bacterium]